jgi:hypothetical protein
LAGEQRFYQHESAVTQTVMKFGIYSATAGACKGKACPVVMYLAGLDLYRRNFCHQSTRSAGGGEFGLDLGVA